MERKGLRRKGFKTKRTEVWMTKGKAAAWLICFALMLLGPGVVYFFARPYLNTENTENRQLAEMPSLSFDSLRGFLTACRFSRLCLTASITTMYPSAVSSSS